MSRSRLLAPLRLPLVALLATLALLALPAFTLGGGEGDDQEGWVELKKGLRYLDLEVGDGEEARPGMMVQMHYTGWLEDGTKFESSLDSGQPFAFQLGRGQVIQGWEKGVVGMREGGRRKLEIPSPLAYGRRGRPPLIPKNANLAFEVELIAVSRGAR
ncbi:MAG TPA: FKBP-type peptidyl-prolyl cis-trans isomerase [Thermoanaerobaculia bacterium]|nr:FKBP-type peptidyl-prolyl cis-trans isomerase [Thermoanaerobaculia bacterium]